MALLAGASLGQADVPSTRCVAGATLQKPGKRSCWESDPSKLVALTGGPTKAFWLCGSHHHRILSEDPVLAEATVKSAGGRRAQRRSRGSTYLQREPDWESGDVGFPPAPPHKILCPLVYPLSYGISFDCLLYGDISSAGDTLFPVVTHNSH